MSFESTSAWRRISRRLKNDWHPGGRRWWRQGFRAFEGTQELEFAKYYSSAIECEGKKAKAGNKMKLVERKLRLAEKILKTVASDDLGKNVERATWIGLFLKEVKSAHMPLDESQRSAENAKRNLKP